ncbi:MAG: hypothetical protein ABIW94_04710 [Gemmatimonadaceae bacterium]
MDTEVAVQWEGARDATRVASVARDMGQVAPDAAILVSTKQ